MKRTSAGRSWMLSLCLAGLFVNGGLAADEKSREQLQKVLADWQKRQKYVDRIRYRIQGEHVTPKGSGTDDVGRPLGPNVPPRDMAGEERWMFLLDFTTGRYRIEINEQVWHQRSGKFIPYAAVVAFDGSRVWSAMPREANPTMSPKQPELIIISGNLRGVPFRHEHVPVAFAHGLIRTIEDEVTPADGLRKRVNPDYFYVHGRGVHAGRPCLVVRTQTLKLGTTSYDEFWVDPARDSAVVRYVMYTRGNTVFNDIHINYQQTPRGWLLQGWTFTSLDGRGRPDVIYRMRVQERTIDPPVSDADFRLEARPGMLIEEREYLEPKTDRPLVDPESKVKLYRLGEEGEREEVPDPYGRPQPAEPRNWLPWLAAGLVAAAGGAAWFLRSRRKR